MEFESLEGSKDWIKIQPGHQQDEKMVLKNKGMYILENEKEKGRGDFVINFEIKIPKVSGMSKEKQEQLKRILSEI